MTESIRAIELVGDSPINWVRESLARGSEVSKYFLERFDLSSGRVSVLAPADLSYTRLYEFETGGVMNVKIANLGLELEIGDFYAGGFNLLLVEDDVRRVGDHSLRNFTSGYIDLKSQIIHWAPMTAENASDSVDLIKRASTGYPLNAFITRFSNAGASWHGDKFDWNFETKINLGFKAVIVSVYDGESYLILKFDT